MSKNNNSECVRSKYFTAQTDMDESLSDFQEVKKSCKGPKPAQIPAKPKLKKAIKRVKGQKDIRIALKEKKNELVSYTKEFDTVCKKSGLDVDSEQLQLAIALSKSLQTDSSNAESSQVLSSQQRAAKIRKTLQEYGFKVPDAKITAGKKTKKHRKKYKLLTASVEEKHQIITAKYTRILFENLDQSKIELDCSNTPEIEARIFHTGSSVPYTCMKDNNIFYVNNLVEKSHTSGSLLRDWSEIPGRPESPKLIDSYIMNFKDIDCSQNELDIILSGSIKCVKDIFSCKEKDYKRKYTECEVPKILMEDEEKKASQNIGSKINHDVINIDDNVGEVDLTENRSVFQKAFNKKSPIKIVLDSRSPVKSLFEIISPIKQVSVNSSSDKVIDVETSNKVEFTQLVRSCSPDIFDDELSSIMETTKPVIALSQEHKTKVFSQDNFMDITQGANIQSQNYEKSIQLSQNVTKRRSNDFMEITDCITGSSQNLQKELKDIDLTQSPEDKIEEDHRINVSKTATSNRISRNTLDEQQITVLSNHPDSDSFQTAKENINLTQNFDQYDKLEIKDDNQTHGKQVAETIDLTQSSNSTDISLPLVDIANSQFQKSLDDTIIVDKNEYNNIVKVKKSISGNEAPIQVFDLTQAQDTSKEYNLSRVKVGDTEPTSNSFYEDYVHDHSENTESSKEIAQNSVIFQHHISCNESKDSNEDIDLTQGSSSSEEMLTSQRPIAVLGCVPNNSSLGKQDDVSIDYDEIIIEDNINDRECSKNNSVTQLHDSSKFEVHNDIEVAEENDDIDINSSQNSEVFQISDKELDYSLHKSRRDFSKENFIQGREKDRSRNSKCDSMKSEIDNDVVLVDDNYDVDIHSSQNYEVFQISDKELDYSLHKSKQDFPNDNFECGGISVLDNVTGIGSYRQSMVEEYQPCFNEHKNDTIEDGFLPEIYINTENKIKETTQLKIDQAEGISPIKVHEVLKSNNGIINIKTPKNSEYIIKTVDVTPMVDYASMTTPQRNSELDRYGLKPFKRKRAIQILTHLYNQTHPTIQQLENDDEPFPSKKPRSNTCTQESPPKRLTFLPENSPSKMVTGCKKTQPESPRKIIYKKPSHETKIHASPEKADNMERDSNMFRITSPKITTELERKITVKSPRKFVYKKPTHEAKLQASQTKTNELVINKDMISALSPIKSLERDSNNLSPLSPIKLYGLERERDISSNDLERDRDMFSATSSNKTDKVKDGIDVCGYEETSEVAVIKSIDCCPDDWVFQKREKAKIHSCRVPLHVAFHNYVLSRRSLREAILKYEPVNIDVIHKDLVGYGHRYDPKDLLKFLDKKCITVKTTDNNARNNKR